MSKRGQIKIPASGGWVDEKEPGVVDRGGESPVVGVGGGRGAESLVGMGLPRASIPSGGTGGKNGLSHSESHNELLAAERGDESMLRRIREEEKGRLEAYRARVPSDATVLPRPPAFFEYTLPLVHQGFTAVVDDSFTRCFKTKKVVRWNWNCYLWPCWAVGVVVRYLILFPLRLLCLLSGFVVVSLAFPIVKSLSFFFNTRPWEIL
jgi:hypothetical protein